MLRLSPWQRDSCQQAFSSTEACVLSKNNWQSLTFCTPQTLFEILLRDSDINDMFTCHVATVQQQNVQKKAAKAKYTVFIEGYFHHF